MGSSCSKDKMFQLCKMNKSSLEKYCDDGHSKASVITCLVSGQERHEQLKVCNKCH